LFLFVADFQFVFWCIFVRQRENKQHGLEIDNIKKHFEFFKNTYYVMILKGTFPQQGWSLMTFSFIFFCTFNSIFNLGCFVYVL